MEDTDHLVSALSAALSEVDLGRISDNDGCDEQRWEQSMIMDVGVPDSRGQRREHTVSKVWHFDPTKHPVPPWRISMEATPAVESLKTYMHLAAKLERDHDDGSYGLMSLDVRTPRYSIRSAIRSSDKSRIENALILPAPASDTHPWTGMRKRKYREKHIAAYGAALLGGHTSPESATASMGAVAWSSSDDLSRHSFIDGSDTSDLRGHKKTKRLKITDTKEVV